MLSLAALNALDSPIAERELLACCGSIRWAREMVGRRPFASFAELEDAADEVWRGLDVKDHLEAFAAHPRIGESRATATSVQAKMRSDGWSADEQAGVKDAGGDVLERLARANHDYESRFGFIFIVCATGKSTNQMLDLIE